MRHTSSAAQLRPSMAGSDGDTKHGPASELHKHATSPNLRTLSQRSSGSTNAFFPAAKTLRTPSRSLGGLLASSQRQRSFAPVRTGPVMKQMGLAAGPGGVVPATSPTRRMLLQKHKSRLRDLSKRLKTSGSSESSHVMVPKVRPSADAARICVCVWGGGHWLGCAGTRRHTTPACCVVPTHASWWNSRLLTCTWHGVRAAVACAQSGSGFEEGPLQLRSQQQAAHGAPPRTSTHAG